jgi:DNA-binding transcriptional regulator YiaG
MDDSALIIVRVSRNIFAMTESPRKRPKSPMSEPIKALRKQMGLSTEQFGRLFAASRRTVEDWELGRSSPRGMTRLMIEKEIAKRSKDSP